MPKINPDKDCQRLEDKLNTELSYIKEKIHKLEEEVDEPLICIQKDRISDIRLALAENEKAIKKLYTWQASVGISLLIFFLTIGVAALRFVDKIDFAVQDNTKTLQELESIIDRHDLLIIEKDELKKLLKDILKNND